MPKLNKNKISDLFNDYSINNLSYRELAEKFRVSEKSVIKILKRNGADIPYQNKFEYENVRYKYDCDHLFFENIDTEEKAYFLGFLYSDGCNQSDSPCVVLALQAGDRDLLERLNSLVNRERPLYFSKRSEKSPNWQDQFRLVISSHKISRDLADWGCLPDKTFKLEWPDRLSQNLWSHFVRGLWDGDGNIEVNHSSCSFIGTVSMCEAIQRIIKDKLGINSQIRGYQASLNLEKNIRVLYITGRTQMRTFLDWLYGESSIYLNRKFEKYQQLANWSPKQKKNLLRAENGDPLSEEEKIQRRRLLDKERHDKNKELKKAGLFIKKEKRGVPLKNENGELLTEEEKKERKNRLKRERRSSKRAS